AVNGGLLTGSAGRASVRSSTIAGQPCRRCRRQAVKHQLTPLQIGVLARYRSSGVGCARSHPAAYLSDRRGSPGLRRRSRRPVTTASYNQNLQFIWFDDRLSVILVNVRTARCVSELLLTFEL